VLENLVAQREEIEAQIAQIRATEQADALVTVRNLIRLHGLQITDVFERKAAAKTASRKATPKYRDPATGTLWTGRGRAPLWFDKSRVQDFSL
jgi:DNA-binding protein H-NS